LSGTLTRLLQIGVPKRRNTLALAALSAESLLQAGLTDIDRSSLILGCASTSRLLPRAARNEHDQ
jgi:hypothetical protein